MFHRRVLKDQHNKKLLPGCSDGVFGELQRSGGRSAARRLRCQLWSACRASAVVGRAWMRRRRIPDTQAHAQGPFKKSSTTLLVRPPHSGRHHPHLLRTQIVFQVSAGRGRSGSSGTGMSASPPPGQERQSHGYLKKMDYVEWSSLKKIVISNRLCFVSVSSANEKIDDINGCPKSRSQMVSDPSAPLFDLTSLCSPVEAVVWSHFKWM